MGSLNVDPIGPTNVDPIGPTNVDPIGPTKLFRAEESRTVKNCDQAGSGPHLWTRSAGPPILGRVTTQVNRRIIIEDPFSKAV